MYKAFDEVVDYRGDEAGFVKLLKAKLAELFVSIISKLEPGFKNGISDVFIFLRANCSNLIMEMLPRNAQAATIKGIAIPYLLTFLEKSWNERPGR